MLRARLWRIDSSRHAVQCKPPLVVQTAVLQKAGTTTHLSANFQSKETLHAQSLSKIWTHWCFYQKSGIRFSLIKPTPAICTLSGEDIKANQCPTLLVGGVSDHVHLLFVLSKNHSIADIVWTIKRSSSKWVKGEGASLRKFHWQEGYGAFSVSQSDVERVRKYILNQEAHHQRKTFQQEFRAFLTKHEIDFDERYVWA